MSSELPPTDFFNGISFNKSFYQSSSDDYLTASTGKKLFLSYPIAQGEEIFASNITLKSTLTDGSGGVGTAGQLLTSTGTATKWATLSTANFTYLQISVSTTLSTSVNTRYLVLFSGSTASQTITIPNSGYNAGQIIQIKSTASVNVAISSGLVNMFLYGASLATSYTLVPNDTFSLIFNGFVWIQYTPTNAFTTVTSAGAITATTGNITATAGNIIGTLLRNASNTGSISTAGVVNGSSMTSPKFDAQADATAGNTALTIGSNVVVGNIVIGATLGAGDVSIATAQATGGTVSIGSGNTETTLSGTVLVSGGGTSGTTGVLVGKTGYDTTSSSFTIPATINSTYILRVAGGTPNINLPTAVIGQTIIIRSIVTGAVTITATASAVIFVNGSAVSVSSFALTTAGTVRLYATTALQWIQI